ncbi:fimbrial protein [Stenotrophomonas humi]|nr:fimbrial protein [Stenotrophomonas humi]
MKTILRMLVLLTGALMVFPSLAQMSTCTSGSGGPLNVPLYNLNGPVVVDASAPLNSEIARILLGHNASTQFLVTCKGETNTGHIRSSLTVTRPKIAGTNLHESGIPGIGMRIQMRSVSGSPSYLSTSVTNDYKWTPLHFVPETEIHLFRVGEIEVGRSLALGEIAEARTMGGGITNELKWMTFRLMDVIQVIPQVMTCGVIKPEMQVRLPSVQAASFNGVGSTLAGEAFQIGMKCKDGVAGAKRNVHVVLTDQSNPANRSDTLSLSDGSDARGVGLQILKDTTVVRYGPDSSEASAENRWLAGSAGNGDFSIPLTARYVQTETEIQPGSVTARATFTISYD